jgi:hypothetical protein
MYKCATAGRTVNRKTGDIYVTHASQWSCPPDCPFMDSGCYGEHGMQWFHTRRINNSKERRPVDIARVEAAEIDALKPMGLPLRLHVVGDCRTDAAARTVGEACERYIGRGGGPVWTYTHAWHHVRRDSWGNALSVLASVESDSGCARAVHRGYGVMRVVAASPPALELGVWCPQQSGKVESCADCLLCARPNLRKPIVVVAHGSGQRKIRASLARKGVL